MDGIGLADFAVATIPTRPAAPGPGVGRGLRRLRSVVADGELLTRLPYVERRATLDGLAVGALGVAAVPAFGPMAPPPCSGPAPPRGSRA